MKTLARFALVAVVFIDLLIVLIRFRYGVGGHSPDRTTAPEMPASVLETVADLELPPGNITVSEEGRIFFTFHPEAKPDVNVAEWVDGEAVPYPEYVGVGYLFATSQRVDAKASNS